MTAQAKQQQALADLTWLRNIAIDQAPSVMEVVEAVQRIRRVIESVPDPGETELDDYRDENAELAAAVDRLESELAEAREALRRIREWDALNPPIEAPYGDAPYFVAMIDRVLEAADRPAERSRIVEAYVKNPRGLVPKAGDRPAEPQEPK